MEVQMLEPVVRPASLTDLAYSQLREGVLSGGLLNGERLSVVALADRLRMSRSPVRSAVERLVAEGLVNLHAAGVTLVQHSHGELLQLLEVRAVLEGLSARLATSRLDSEALADLETIHRRFGQAVEESDVGRARTLDLHFHQAVMAATGNAFLIEDLTRVQARVIVGTYTIAWSPAQRQAVAEHRAILDALAAGEATEAESRAVLHMERLMDRIRAAAG
jgi:DNA-binding GntR family transcriptional regulator